MPFEGRETPVQEVELPCVAPDVRTLASDERAQLGRHSLTVAGGTQGSQLPRPVEGNIQCAEADQESEPLDVRSGVPAITILGALGGAHEPLGFVEPNGLRRRAGLASQLTDLHALTVDLPVAGMSRPVRDVLDGSSARTRMRGGLEPTRPPEDSAIRRRG
jgi:hypothetical protein